MSRRLIQMLALLESSLSIAPDRACRVQLNSPPSMLFSSSCKIAGRTGNCGAQMLKLLLSLVLSAPLKITEVFGVGSLLHAAIALLHSIPWPSDPHAIATLALYWALSLWAYFEHRRANVGMPLKRETDLGTVPQMRATNATLGVRTLCRRAQSAEESKDFGLGDAEVALGLVAVREDGVE